MSYDFSCHYRDIVATILLFQKEKVLLKYDKINAYFLYNITMVTSWLQIGCHFSA